MKGANCKSTLKIPGAIILSLLIVSCSRKPVSQESFGAIDYVNPMIGAVANTKYYGRTSPAACLPASLVQLGPDTYTGGDIGSGYSYEHGTIEGFSFIHMSGIGWFGDFGNLLVTPTNGTFHPNRGRVEEPSGGYRSAFSHETETAKAGYYSVVLDDYRIRAEMTTTQRAGIVRFTFPKDSTNRIQIDLARRIGGTSVKQYIKVIDDHSIQGWMECTPDGGGWGNGKTNMVFYTVYFHAEFSESFADHFIWSANIPGDQPRKVEDIGTDKYQEYIRNSRTMCCGEYEGKHLGFYAGFPAIEDGGEVMFKAGISFVDIEGAKNNLEQELNHWDFERIRSEAEKKWSEQLDLIKIKGATEKQKEIFYTGLYRASVDPRRFTDCDGRFYLKETGINDPTDFNYRTIFSGWDAFRSHIPLLTIIDPNSVNDLVNSLVMKGDVGGMGFPKWEIAGCYSNCMLGDPAISVILDSWTKGIRNYDFDKALLISKQTSLGPNTIRNGWENYNKKGYVACDTVPERWRGYYKGVSATLENCYADWCISQMALISGDKDAEMFAERAQYYQNLFDQNVGFFRGKFKCGDWIPWIDELDFNAGCIESNPLQQMWFVTHDIGGLKKMLGEERFLSELENLFGKTPSDFSFNAYYNHANEPVHHIPYLFNYTHKPWLTQKWVRYTLENAYDNTPYGIMGNEDVGQMSAWYILSAMGFHPVCPGDGKYMLGSPLFPEVEIKLDRNYYKGGSFRILAENNSEENIYVKNVFLNGKKLDRPYIYHNEITDGGVLIFEMDHVPNTNLYQMN